MRNGEIESISNKKMLYNYNIFVIEIQFFPIDVI